jgi:hypothetical protein
MPALKTYDLFISHAWEYNADYYKIEHFLNQAPLFKWRNYSVPEHNPLISPESKVGRNKLIGMLDIQIRPSNCILILGGMYASYSDWIISEIMIAKKYKKPIIGIYPWGQQRMPSIIQESATEIVGWNTSSIINAIRKNSI